MTLRFLNAIAPSKSDNLKWSGFQISDPIQNLSHLQTKPRWSRPFRLQSSPDFRSPLYPKIELGFFSRKPEVKASGR